MMDKHKNSKMAVSCDHALKALLETAQTKYQNAYDIYQDKDGMRADDIQALAGVRSDKKPGDVWTSFYDKVKEVKDYHRRFTVNTGMPEVQSSKWFYERAYEADKTENIFSGEEDFGKRVDMHEIFVKYLNNKKISAHRKQRFQEQTYARLKKKNPELTADDDEVKEAMDSEFHELDYIQWLGSFDQFHEIPRYCKYKEKEYTDYLQSIVDYLKSFMQRTTPLVDNSSLEKQFEKEFEERYSAGSILGWESATRKEQLFCLPTNKLFKNENTMKSHKEGKQYKKRMEEVNKMSLDDQQKLNLDSEAEDKRIARLESMAAKWRDLLSEPLAATVQYLQKKQSQTVEEMEMDKDEDSDDDMMESGGEEVDDAEMEDDTERPIYNPLNLPLGWDGKPIPFWLYKLHGLGIEYRCEICGNCSYWGRRAFERHFNEWRHAFGMRCLKIPNTAHFKEITKIEDAITLYEKLKRDAEEQTFKPDADVECEDIQGNVMSQKAFEDLRRQGLV